MWSAKIMQKYLEIPYFKTYNCCINVEYVDCESWSHEK